VTTARSAGDIRCDLSSAEATAALLAESEPAYVLHAAGETDVEGCEADEWAAFAANRDGAANLAAAMPEAAGLVYFSTDQVYPDTAGPHREDDDAPVNAYGRSKRAGEAAALGHPRCLVLRTNFFGASRTRGRRSLSDFVVEGLRDRRPITLFEDVLFSPLHMATLARLAADLAEAGMTGVFNAGCRDGASKAAFGLAVARHLGLQTETARVGCSDDQPGRAPRPHDLRLDVSRLEATGRRMPTLAEEIGKL
jgi:dTDP-4-dehydrorhamnose reductase